MTKDGYKSFQMNFERLDDKEMGLRTAWINNPCAPIHKSRTNLMNGVYKITEYMDNDKVRSRKRMKVLGY